METQRKLACDEVVKTLYYIKDIESEKELDDVKRVLAAVRGGMSSRILSSMRVQELENTEKLRDHFDRNPRSYVVLVGATRIPSAQIVGVAKSCGIPSRNLHLFTDYSKLRDNFPHEACGSDHCLGVIVGHIPHSTSGSNGNTSPLDSFCKKLISTTSGLKLTKERLKHLFSCVANKISPFELKEDITEPASQAVPIN